MDQSTDSQIAASQAILEAVLQMQPSTQSPVFRGRLTVSISWHHLSVLSSLKPAQVVTEVVLVARIASRLASTLLQRQRVTPFVWIFEPPSSRNTIISLPSAYVILHPWRELPPRDPSKLAVRSLGSPLRANRSSSSPSTTVWPLSDSYPTQNSPSRVSLTTALASWIKCRP